MSITVIDSIGVQRHLGGWKPSKLDHRDFKLSIGSIASLPASINLIGECPDVLDQGSLGSCTANSSCAALQYLAIKSGIKDPYSRLFLYYYTRAFEGTPPEIDSGAELRSVMKVLASVGTCYESTWPYEIEKFSTSPSIEAIEEANKHKALFYYNCPDLFTIKSSLTQGFPVIFGFSVPENMMNSVTKEGLVLYPSANEGFVGGHAVLAIGYDDSKQVGDSIGAVYCRNSWGANWGDNGNFWLPYRFWHTSLASDCWTIRRTQV